MDISTLYNGHFHDLGSRPSKLHLPDEVRFLHLVLLCQLRSAAGRTDAADHIIKVHRQEIRLFQLERVLLSLQLLPRVFGDAKFKRLRPTGGETDVRHLLQVHPPRSEMVSIFLRLQLILVHFLYCLREHVKSAAAVLVTVALLRPIAIIGNLIPASVHTKAQSKPR